MLEGFIEVESEVGKGSAFTLYLPEEFTNIEESNAEKESESHTNEEPRILPVSASFDGKKILVVDDDVRNVYALTSILEPKNIEVLHAENGKMGIDVLKENPDVDLVLMDTMMPEMDGLQATRLIREDKRFKDLPIISLTAKAMKGDREKCLSAGASEYITKPVDKDELLAAIHAWTH